MAACTILDTTVAHGMKPNLKRGKTEAVLHLVGPGAAQCQREVALAGGIAFVSAYHGPQILLTTRKYQHMGSVSQPTDRFLPEIRNRAGQAKTVLRQLSHVFRNEGLEQDFRFQLIESLLDTRTFYGAATWPALKATEQEVIAQCRVLAFRYALGLHNAELGPAGRATDAEVIRRAAQVPTDVLLKVARLRYLRRLLAAAPPPLKALVQQAHARGAEWSALLIDDLRWLRARENDRLAELPDPAAEFVPWQLFHRGIVWPVGRSTCENNPASQAPRGGGCTR